MAPKNEKIMNFRCTLEEYCKFEELAEKQKMTVSALLRVMMQRALGNPPLDERVERLEERLNSLARWAVPKGYCGDAQSPVRSIQSWPYGGEEN